MSSHDIPTWISVERGSAPVLLLAPHGGRRHDVRVPGKHKVNDLRTAEVTRELAGVLGASAIINERMDRNTLDLNRVSQVRRDAPWLLDLVTELLDEMVARVGRATVLVVHGWNVSQVACDVGVGMREEAGELAEVRPGSATISTAFVASHLRPFQEAAARSDIVVTIGSRYPAAHPNNLLQIFAAAGDREVDDLAAIAELCRRAPVEAAQLELAIPLRWPGPRRQRFLALVAEVFGDRPAAPSSRRAAHVSVPRFRVAGGRVLRRRGLQLVTDDVLLMTSIEAGADGVTGGRVVVSESADRLSLFTGELSDPGRDWTVPPLACRRESDAILRFTYDGPLVTFPTHTPFLDLERGLADGAVVEARVDLTFEAQGSEASDAECFGAVHGDLVIDGRCHVIATLGAATTIDAPARSRFPYCRLTLPLAPFGACMLTSDGADPWEHADGRLSGELVGTVENGRRRDPVCVAVAVEIAGDGGTLRLDPVRGPSAPASTRARLERVIPVRRPGPAGTVIATTFALVRVAGASVGWLEVSVVEDPESRS